jgi:hypothetical protein
VPAHALLRVQDGKVRLKPGAVPEDFKRHRLIDVHRDRRANLKAVPPSAELRIGVLDASGLRQKVVIALAPARERSPGHGGVEGLGYR